MRNIRRSRKHDDLVSRLAERPVSEQLNQKIFPTYKALMCFAACLGFDRGAEEDVIDPVDFVDSRVIERDADCIVLDHGLPSDAAGDASSEDDAYYAQFQVPDDLMW